MAAARKSSRYGHRDATMILLAYRHGLRASEVCDLQWHQVELAAGRLHASTRSLLGSASAPAWLSTSTPPHMLRHGCGYALAKCRPRYAGYPSAWMGHKNIQHTVRYTELAPDRFKDFWRD